MNETHTQSLNKTEFMEPMTDEAIQEYAQSVVSEMDEDKVISGQGMDFITRTDNVPNEEDQERIMTLIEELYNGQKEAAKSDEAVPGTEESVGSSEETEPSSGEDATQEEAPVDTVAEVEAVVPETV